MSVDSFFDLLKERVQGRLDKQVDLSRLTTYRLGGPAAVYLEAKDVGDLEAVAAALSEEGPVSVLPLGRGSNLLVSDAGFPGLVVRLGAPFAELKQAGDIVAIGGAVALPQVSNWTARRGLTGMEFAIAIPGSLGGGVRMDAGAHGGDMSQTLVTATVFDLATGVVEERAAGSLGLSYRRSSLVDTDVVVEARFELASEDPARVRAKVDDFRKERAASQPPAVQNAGSVFKNPPGDHAGRLVEAAGLKGFSLGKVSVSDLHANFFIAAGGASAQDVYDLVHEVRRRVLDAFGVQLEPEVRFVGSFRERSELT